MQVSLLRVAFWGYLTLFLVGCSQAVVPDIQDDATLLPTEALPGSVSPRGEITQMAPTPSTPAAPNLQQLVEKAKADLAQRLSIPASEISLVEATAVVWPNASLGCPKPGMAYAEVLTPGFLIILNAGNQAYEYHAGRGTEVIYCENPMPPVPGTPGDT